MKQFVHPALTEVSLATVLAALADPIRLHIVRSLAAKQSCMSCTEATPCPNIAKSTLSHHFRILREAGLIRTIKQGVENRSALRSEELEARFPGLLAQVLKLAKNEENPFTPAA